MRIIYIAGSFPKPEEGSTIYTDLAEELCKNGHEVVVMVPTERKKIKRTVWRKERGLSILRVKTGNFFDVGFIEKGISILSMEYILKLAIRKYLNNLSFDLILFEAPPVTNCGVIKYAKKVFKAKAFLMLKDIFPQNAVDIGIMKKNSLMYKLFKRKEKKLYNVSDQIGCMSQGNMNYILKHNPWLDKSKVMVFPNTKKIKDIDNFNTDYSIRAEYGIPLNSTVFIFGGNMGKPQGIDFLCKSIKELENERDIFFLLVGRGTERGQVRSFIEHNSLKNVLQIDNLPRDRYETLVRSCDVGIVLLDYRFTIPNYPSRILSYMEYSIPVIAATDNNTDFKELISESQCGLWCYSDDLNEFCYIIRKMAKDSEGRKFMGANGRKYLEENFSVIKSVKLLESVIGV